jgi:probable rRNA maturation factor
VFQIEVTNQQSALAVQPSLLERAAANVLQGERIQAATVSIAVVDDETIRDLNRRYLEHDYATDVLSFTLERDERCLEGEVVVSAETAVRAGAQFGWSANDELLLYVVHGVLHLVGFDDQTAPEREAMRGMERKYLGALGVTPPDEAQECGMSKTKGRQDSMTNSRGGSIR